MFKTSHKMMLIIAVIVFFGSFLFFNGVHVGKSTYETIAYNGTAQLLNKHELAGLRGGRAPAPAPTYPWCSPESDCAGTSTVCGQNSVVGLDVGDPCGTATDYSNIWSCTVTAYNDTSCSGTQVLTNNRDCKTISSCVVGLVGGENYCTLQEIMSVTYKSDWTTSSCQ